MITGLQYTHEVHAVRRLMIDNNIHTVNFAPTSKNSLDLDVMQRDLASHTDSWSVTISSQQANSSVLSENII
jgi:hypothetical protein